MTAFDIGWPWMGFGGALVLLILLFATNIMRGQSGGSRWWDPVWLAWLAVPMYLVHQFEEYPLHFDAMSGTYAIVAGVCKAQGYAPFPDCGIPMAHFPLVNIALVWVAAPIAAWLCRRNPVVGLTYYGFILVNGLLHAVTGLFVSGGPIESPGAVSGTFMFIPATIWVCYACLKSGVMSGKALTVSLVGGIVGHIGLAGAYLFVKVAGAAGMYVADVFISFLPILVAHFGSKLVGTSTTPARHAAA